MEVVFVNPEIPQNTGSTARLAAATGVRLHLVEPLGFTLESRYLKRAGLDYWPDVEMLVHSDWDTLCTELQRGTMRPLESRLKLFTARGGCSLFEAKFERDDVLVFGAESSGLPATLLDQHPHNRIRIPTRASVRSLNLANVACLGLYTALAQIEGMLPETEDS